MLRSSQRPPNVSAHLLGIRAGQTVAAISLSIGELLADPFQRTAEVCELLRCHAGGARVAPAERPEADRRVRPEVAFA